MRGQRIGRLRGSAVVAAPAALLGLAACTSSPWSSDSEPGPDRAAASAPGPDQTAAPTPQTDQTPGSYDHLAGAWSSTVYRESHVEVSIPAGGSLRLRVRCTGTGEFRTAVSTPYPFKMTFGWRCSDRWEFSGFWIPASGSDVANQDHGTVTIAVDRPKSITAWDVEAYYLGPTGQDSPNASPRPSTS
ncbi:hypothetical protein [Dactylosporangium sp. CA-139066]|uniref:hypothetical protein n=1 Tax=Dactylosporangium sp. CA-139066 TaxID=3239930 RepID=UPI003D92549F